MAKVKGKVGSTRVTKNYKRTRLAQPSGMSEFRTIKNKSGFVVIGKSKKTGKWKAQATATKRKK